MSRSQALCALTTSEKMWEYVPIATLGGPGFSPPQTLFPPAHLLALGQALRPLFDSWIAGENEEKLQGTLFFFENHDAFAIYHHKPLCRGWILPELLDALEGLVEHTKHPSDFAQQVLALLLRYRQDRAAEIIPKRVQQDRDWISSPEVLFFLLNRRLLIATGWPWRAIRNH